MSLFTRYEISRVNWNNSWVTPCPYCDAASHNFCRRTTKDGTQKLMYGSFHQARKTAYLLSTLFIIPEEQELTDLLVNA